MKSWHIVVMDGYKVIHDIQKFDIAESKTIFAEMKEKYKETKYRITREWY